MPRGRTNEYRKRLISKVQHYDIIMDYKCVRCNFIDLDCQRSAYSTFYLFCLTFRNRCNMEPFSEFKFAKLDRERARLDAKLKAAEDFFKAILIKRKRLVKQKKFLARRKAEIIRRGLANVNKLKKLEKQKKKKRQKTVAGFLTSQLATPGSDFNFFEADFAEMVSMSPFFLKALVFDKTF